jgi:hypothetical protein
MTGFVSKRQAAQAKLDDDTQVYADRKRGSIALARSLCYQINGAADDSDDMDGGGYGSIDVAEILSAEVVRLQAALAQPEQEPVAHPVIVGALFDFMGWLTSRKERLALSRVDDASPAVDAITDFAKMRGLSLDDARVLDWHTTSPAAQRPWVGLTEWEREAIAHACGAMGAEWLVFIEAVEKALKEKNR